MWIDAGAFGFEVGEEALRVEDLEGTGDVQIEGFDLRDFLGCLIAFRGRGQRDRILAALRSTDVDHHATATATAAAAACRLRGGDGRENGEDHC